MSSQTEAPRGPSGQPVGLTTVSFVCQQCSQPCKLDASLGSELDSQSANQLSTAIGQPPSLQEAGTPQQAPDPTPLVYRKINSLRPIDQQAPSMLWTADGSGKTSLFHSTQVAQHLFNVMSGMSNVDHPLCEECTDTLLDQLDTSLRDAEEENRGANEFLARVQAAEAAEAANAQQTEQQLQAEMAKLQQEEAALVHSLQGIELDKASVKREQELLATEAKKLDADEDRYWREYNEYQLEMQEFTDENNAVAHKYKGACMQLENLKKTNVFNDVFHIWHDGHFGTINNFRLGRLPSVPVEWNEINAAWGQTVLLLHTMATRLGFKFSRYRLVPNGSHSRLERIDDQAKELPLYGSSGFKLFWESKFDQAMVAFLDCLQQFKDHVESRDVHFKLPYKINKDKIGDSNGELSVKIQLNHEETWTKALKFMLTNLKWCLAWVCKQMS